MPEEQQRFATAVDRMMDAIIFENWLRFYFIAERAGQEDGEPELVLSIPDKAMEKIRSRYGTLQSMAEYLNGREASLENSRSAIVDFVRQELEGTLIPVGGVAAYFDTRAFQGRNQVFNAWVQAAEEMLDRQFLDFDQWKQLFAAYCETDSAKHLMERLEADGRV